MVHTSAFMAFFLPQMTFFFLRAALLSTMRCAGHHLIKSGLFCPFFFSFLPVPAVGAKVWMWMKCVLFYKGCPEAMVMFSSAHDFHPFFFSLNVILNGSSVIVKILSGPLMLTTQGGQHQRAWKCNFHVPRMAVCWAVGLENATFMCHGRPRMAVC